MKCIEIMLKDDGTFVVAECPPSEEMQGEMEGGKTYDNADDAMTGAMELLTLEGRESELEGAMDAGYNKVAGKRGAGGLLKPPMGGMMGEE